MESLINNHPMLTFLFSMFLLAIFFATVLAFLCWKFPEKMRKYVGEDSDYEEDLDHHI